MKTFLRKIFIPTLISVGAILSVTYFSCTRDKCKSTVCANGGVCSHGACICPAGYQGPNCETVSRTKFLGTWQVFEKGSTTNSAQYPISIQSSNNISQVVINNFFNYFDVSINAYVSGDTLIIPNQQYQGKVIFGVGYIVPNSMGSHLGTIYMSYEVVDTATNVPDDFGYYPSDLSAPSVWR